MNRTSVHKCYAHASNNHTDSFKEKRKKKRKASFKIRQDLVGCFFFYLCILGDKPVKVKPSVYATPTSDQTSARLHLPITPIYCHQTTGS